MTKTVRIMGILNATPDSFSDGGELDDAAFLKAKIQAMLAAGADILDVGGESTRPGHTPIPADIEIARVRPVIRAIRALDDLVDISIDTSKAEVADAALRAGATMVNDVSGLSDPEMANVVRNHKCPVVLMRNQDLDGNIVDSCREELAAIVERARQAGIPKRQIILDPGLGFGARPGPHVEDNLSLLDHIALYSAGFPVLIGASRKRFVGTISGEEEPRNRIAASVDLAVRAAGAGAFIVRVHDVAETVNALR